MLARLDDFIMSKTKPDTYAEAVYGKKYCSSCKKYNSHTGYCDMLKRKIKHPNEPYCSWWDRLEAE